MERSRTYREELELIMWIDKEAGERLEDIVDRGDAIRHNNLIGMLALDLEGDEWFQYWGDIYEKLESIPDWLIQLRDLSRNAFCWVIDHVRPSSLGTSLSHSFVWATTPHGHEYWNKLNEALSDE